MFSLTKIEQGAEKFIAAGWQDAVKVGHFVESSVVPVLQKAETNSATIEQITSIISPKAAAVEATVFGENGLVAKALSAISAADATATDATAGKPVTVDITDLVAALKAIV